MMLTSIVIGVRHRSLCLAAALSCVVFAQAALAADPVGDTIKEARQLNRKGENQAAVKLLQDGIDAWRAKSVADDQDANAFYQLARLLAEYSRDEEALLAVDRAIELQPKKAAYVRLRSQLLGYMERYDDSLKAMQSAVELAPKNLNYRDELASQLLDAERYDEAEKLCREVLAQEAGRAKTTISLAVALRHLDRAGEALEPINAVVEKDPDNFNARVMQALVLEDTNSLPKAYEAYQAALRLDPQAQAVISRLVVLAEILKHAADGEKYRAMMREQFELGKTRERYFARDEFRLGDRYSVLGFEYYELTGDQALRYWFDVADLQEDTNFRISLGSYSATNEIARQTGMIDGDERLFHLDLYQGRKHETYGMFRGEPSYAQTRNLVIAILDGDLKPWSASERPAKPGDKVAIELPNFVAPKPPEQSAAKKSIEKPGDQPKHESPKEKVDLKKETPKEVPKLPIEKPATKPAGDPEDD